MIDVSLLRLLKHREHYERLYKSLPDTGLDARTKTILQDFGAWFKQYPKADIIDLGAFSTFFFGIKHPAIAADPEKHRYYTGVLRNIEPDLEEHIEQGLREQLLELDNATRAANLIERYSSGEDLNVMRELATLVEDHALQVDKKVECPWVRPDLGELLAEESDTSGLKFRLTVLSEHMRGLQGGDLILVCGRPDSGKTSFLASEITYMAAQLEEDRPVIWFNNEGPGKRILLRNYQAAVGAPLSALSKMHKAGAFMPAYEEALNGTKDKIRIIDIHDFYFYEVEDIIRDMNPGLVIMDMVDNIKFTNMSGASRTDQVLEAMYQQTRRLGVKYDCPIIATSQISNEGDGLMYPTKGMLKDSKTGKQGACDAMIMIGQANDQNLAQIRGISTPKNKLKLEGKPSCPTEEVQFRMDISRYEDSPEG
jgi:replicative DNA helicase